MTKTNAMRALDQARIPYEVFEYVPDESDLSGVHIAAQIGLSVNRVYKTLVAKGDRTGIMVFCIPCHREIDLKRAASVTGNKKVELLHVKDLLPTTGYIRGGCSPIGMKKRFPTYYHSSILDHETVYVSAGVRGLQIEISPASLIGFTCGTVADIGEEM